MANYVAIVWIRYLQDCLIHSHHLSTCPSRKKTRVQACSNLSGPRPARNYRYCPNYTIKQCREIARVPQGAAGSSVKTRGQISFHIPDTHCSQLATLDRRSQEHSGITCYTVQGIRIGTHPIWYILTFVSTCPHHSYGVELIEQLQTWKWHILQ